VGLLAPLDGAAFNQLPPVNVWVEAVKGIVSVLLSTTTVWDGTVLAPCAARKVTPVCEVTKP
jgi:hypothetical protein